MRRAIGVGGLLVIAGLACWAMVPQNAGPIRSGVSQPTQTPLPKKAEPLPEKEPSETIDLSRSFEPVAEEDRVPTLSELVPVVHQEQLPYPAVLEPNQSKPKFDSPATKPAAVKVLEITGNELNPFLPNGKGSATQEPPSNKELPLPDKTSPPKTESVPTKPLPKLPLFGPPLRYENQN